jgi:hypothetical protein
MPGKRFYFGLTALLAFCAATMLMTGVHTASANSALASSGNLPTAYFHPAVLYFTIGITSSRTTTLTNSSAQSLLIQSFTLQGGKASNFTLSTTCGFSLAAGHSCTVTLTGFATTAGLLAKLVEYDNSAAGHHTVLLEAKEAK